MVNKMVNITNSVDIYCPIKTKTTETASRIENLSRPMAIKSLLWQTKSLNQ